MTARTIRNELRRRPWLALLGVLVLVLLLATRVATFYTDVLWFQTVGFEVVYWRRLATQLALGVTAGLLVTGLLAGNLLTARRLAPAYRIPSQGEQSIERYRQAVSSFARPLLLVIAAVFGVLSGAAMLAQWEVYLLWANAQPFGMPDPQFGRDLGFFVFVLPFYGLVNSWLFTSLSLTIVLTALAHYVFGGIRPQAPGQKITPMANVHLSVLLAALVAVRAWGFWLDRYLLSYSERGHVTGLSYTDVNAQLRAYQLLTVIAAVCVVLFLANIRVRGWLLPSSGVAILLVAALLLGGIYPAVIQRLQVAPQELRRETEYIERNLFLTRFAYGIDEEHVDYVPFPATGGLSPQQVTDNRGTLESVRLWDPMTLETVYNQVQAFRQFYGFDSVDVDRYEIDGEPRQVMVAVRELEASELSPAARTWQNQALTFTHGYGYVASPVSTAGGDGQPEYLVQDMPLAGPAPLMIAMPQVYFGERGPEYSIVGTAQDEFDYPVGEGQATHRYEGQAGVRIGSPLRRLAFALRFGEPNIVLSGLIDDDSRILIRRRIDRLVRDVAPFLKLDDDPYPVAVEGRIKWIIDGYTTTDMVPYSQRMPLERLTQSVRRGIVQVPQPNGQVATVEQLRFEPGLTGRANYIRNSVRAVVDAYDGTVTLYATDPDDPILNAWDSAFPGILRPVGEASQELRSHFRYPEDMFMVQSAMLASYHIQEAAPFFTREDLWSIPLDVAFASNQENAPGASVRQRPLPPSYQLLRLPDAEQEQFTLVQTFAPAQRQNLASYLAGTVDDTGQGRLRVLQMPPSETVFGPEQVQARIEQDGLVSQQITFWNDAGSVVIRGNLITIPVADSLLYVQPLFLRATTSDIPELRRVVLVLGERVVMGERLDDALALLFGQPIPGIAPGPVAGTPVDPEAAVSDPRVAQLIQQAIDAFAAADQALRGGNLGDYQSQTRAAEAALREAQRVIQGGAATP
ncbi:MAG: UPF0182 family protein [Egibacteraceae bacterium]